MATGKRHFQLSGLFGQLSGLFWLAAAFTLVMALLPHPPALPGRPSDKIEHMLAFATLTALAVTTYRRVSHMLVFAALTGFGAVIELLQTIPALHRDAELADWLADCAAILMTLGLCAAIKAVRRRE